MSQSVAGDGGKGDRQTNSPSYLFHSLAKTGWICNVQYLACNWWVCSVFLLKNLHPSATIHDDLGSDKYIWYHWVPKAFVWSFRQGLWSQQSSPAIELMECPDIVSLDEKAVSWQESGELYNYFKWSHYLKEKMSWVTQHVTSFTDEEMHTEKNAIVVGLRKN